MSLLIRGIKGGVLSFRDLLRALRGLGPAICDLLWGLFRRLRDCRRRKTPPRSTDCCIRLPNTSYKRADPLIYSQQYLMKQGLSVTWDNPDIQLFKGGVPVNSHNLETDTLYEVQVTVWNGSYDAPAIGLPVHLSYMSFGVGAASTVVGIDYVNLGVKGSSQHPAVATFPLEDTLSGGPLLPPGPARLG